MRNLKTVGFLISGILMLGMVVSLVWANLQLSPRNLRQEQWDYFHERAQLLLDMHFNKPNFCRQNTHAYYCMKAAHDADDHLTALLNYVPLTAAQQANVLTVMARSDPDYLNAAQAAAYNAVADGYAKSLAPEAQRWGWKDMNAYMMID